MPATVAMIGLTHPHSRMYLETLDVTDDVGAIILYDPDEGAARDIAARYPKTVASYTTLTEALAHPGVTHALVALPNDQTPAALVQVIEAGVGLFTEKPGARTVAEFLPVLAALERRPVPFGIAYMNRWQPTLRQMRDLYQGGALGTLRSVELRMVTTQVRLRDPKHWLFKQDVAGGGILTWLACHWLDLIRYISGEEFTRVGAELATLSDEPITVEDTAAVNFRLSGGAVGTLHAGYLLSTGNAGYEGTNSDWTIILRGSHGALTYHRGAQDEPMRLETNAPGWAHSSPRLYHFSAPAARGYGGLAGVDFFRAFLAASPTDATPAGPTDALRVLELLDAIYEAGRTGRSIEVAHRAL